MLSWRSVDRDNDLARTQLGGSPQAQNRSGVASGGGEQEREEKEAETLDVRLKKNRPDDSSVFFFF